jgi:tRNA(His) 5'-end guanylyltransferase
MNSILASMTTAYFNRRLAEFLPSKADKLPMFDARVWNVPNRREAINYLYWRELDATRNSITMAAQSLYSHNELHGVNSARKQDLLMAKGVNWSHYPSAFKRGTYCQRRKTVRPFSTEELKKLPPKHNARLNPNLVIERTDVVVLDMPPLSRIQNKEAVIFEGADPITAVLEVV